MKIGIYTIDKEGYQIIRRATIIATLILASYFFLCPTLITWVTITVLFFVLGMLFMVIRFFRIPDRHIVENYDGVLSPADGTIVAIEKVFVDEYLQEERMQVSIFMSIWNVHANWYPISGEVEYFKHHHGRFLFANNPKSSTLNERTSTVVNHEGSKIMFRQIAGYVARRIVSYATVGDKVKQNHRCGFIKFGSRLDVFIPLEWAVNVKMGEKVVATETVLAYKETVDNK